MTENPKTILTCPPSCPNERARLGLPSSYDPGALGYQERVCERCNLAIFAGPRQLALHESTEEVSLLCFVCAIKVGGETQEVSHLGGA